MNYQKHYNRLINNAQNRSILQDVYSEKHHIVPKCMDGTNNKDNIVSLYPEEHFVAHQLLVKIYPNNSKLAYAAHMMTFGTDKHKRSNKLYGWLRRRLSIACSQLKKGVKTGKPAWNRGLEGNFTGQNHTEESKKKISESKLGIKRILTEDHKEKLRNNSLGSTRTEESLIKMSKSKTGISVGKGKPKSIEHNLKNSIAHKGKIFTQEHKDNIKKSQQLRRIKELENKI